MSLGLLLLLGPARAADPLPVDPSRFPLRVELQVGPPVAGSSLVVPVPIELRRPGEPTDGSDLLLLDPEGRPRAFALASGEGEPQRVALRVQPEGSGRDLVVDPLGRPLSAVEVDLGPSPWVARVRVEPLAAGATAPSSEPVLLWETDQGRQVELPLRAGPGPFRLRIEQLHGDVGRLPTVDGLLYPGLHVEPVRRAFPVADPVLLEEGWARYVVELGQPLPVRSVRLEVEDPIFERAIDPRQVSELDPYAWPTPTTSVRRVRLGGAELDQVRVPVSPGQGDLLVFFLESKGVQPLRIPSVEVELEGRELRLPAATPGTWTLLGGAPPGTTAPAELNIALPELARGAAQPLQVGTVEANPAWRPPEVRAGLGLPGAELSLRGMRFQHLVEGPAGLVRLPLSAEVLADSQQGLRDLRLIDREGRQIPFLLRRTPVDPDLGELAFTRSEEGSRSVLRAALPLAGSNEDGPPISTVRVSTAAPLFSRMLSVARVRGPSLEPVRAAVWVGAERPTTLSLDIATPLGRELVVLIENGDDPPLPIDRLSASVQGMELLALLPEGGARLVYGDRAREAPDYDLGLLRDEIFSRPSQPARLGPRASLEPEPLSAGETAMVWAGLLSLLAGLLALVLGLLRTVEVEPAAATGEGGA